MYASFDFSTLGIAYIKFAATEPTEKEFDEYLNGMYSIVEKKQPTVLIFDSTDTKYLSSDLRIKQGNWLKQHHDELHKYIPGAAFIIPSMMVRVVFNCILAIQKLPYPHTVVAKREDAMAWAREKAETMHQPV